MSGPEEKFTRELEIFRTEAQAGAQFLYSYLAFNSIISENKRALAFVNHAPLFWKTNMGALQTSFFIVLGRIFDQSSRHNIDVLVSICENNSGIFSKAALAVRKKRDSANAHEWLDGYLERAYEPTPHDFRELRKKVREYRKLYESNYRDIRRKIYAHKEITESAEVEKLFSKTNTRELQRVFVFVNAFYEALWELFHNGRKPVLRPMRYSVRSIRKRRRHERQSDSVHVRIIGETQDLFQLCLAKVRSSTGRAARRKLSLGKFAHDG